MTDPASVDPAARREAPAARGLDVGQPTWDVLPQAAAPGRETYIPPHRDRLDAVTLSGRPDLGPRARRSLAAVTVATGLVPGAMAAFGPHTLAWLTWSAAAFAALAVAAVVGWRASRRRATPEVHITGEDLRIRDVRGQTHYAAWNEITRLRLFTPPGEDLVIAWDSARGEHSVPLGSTMDRGDIEHEIVRHHPTPDSLRLGPQHAIEH